MHPQLGEVSVRPTTLADMPELQPHTALTQVTAEPVPFVPDRGSWRPTAGFKPEEEGWIRRERIVRHSYEARRAIWAPFIGGEAVGSEVARTPSDLLAVEEREQGAQVVEEPCKEMLTAASDEDFGAFGPDYATIMRLAAEQGIEP